MKVNLERRIAALEARQCKVPTVRHIFIMPMGALDDTIRGFKSNQHVVWRERGETLESLEARMVEAIGNDTIAIIVSIME